MQIICEPKPLVTRLITERARDLPSINQKGVVLVQSRALSVALSLLVVAQILTHTGCVASVNAASLMDGVSAQTVAAKSIDSQFQKSAAEFSLELFKNASDHSENNLFSPLSILLALAMTANGAEGETLAQMETVLGRGIPLAELNEYLYSYSSNLPSLKKCKLKIANSIWFRDEAARLQVEKAFLQTNANYYGAEAYKSPFNKQTLAEINNWVKAHTDGMIEEILESIDADAVMYLLNAIVFDAEWEKAYTRENVRPGTFFGAAGRRQEAEFMHSEESLYIETESATGFIKPYAGGKYSFVALLPKEDDLANFLSTLSGESFLQTIVNAENTLVNASLPKFGYDCSIVLNDCLKNMGMPLAFSAAEAEFAALGKSSLGNIFIGEVVHKTFIQVDEKGTKAGAVTKVEVKDEAYFETKSVILDRPFAYAIIDTATNLPIFIGSLFCLPGES